MQDHLSGEENEKSQPSRKEKSLGLLCHKFLALYPSYPNTSKASAICLDEVAEELSKFLGKSVLIFISVENMALRMLLKCSAVLESEINMIMHGLVIRKNIFT